MINVLTPSRGRPDLAKRMYESATDTAKGDVNIVFGLDHDDPTIAEYAGLPYEIFRDCPVGKIWNGLANNTKKGMIMMGNDDLIFRTPGWDEYLLDFSKTLTNSSHVIYFNDGINGKDHCAFPIISRSWYKKLKYFTPECFNFLYHDTWVMDIAKKCNELHYCDDVLIEHMHFTAGKSEMDDTYKRHREGQSDKRQIDGYIYHMTDWIRQRDAEAIKCK